MFINPMVEDFLNHLELERNMSIGTVRGYRSNLKLFYEFLQDRYGIDPANCNVEDIRSRHVRQFLAYLHAEVKNSPKTISLKLTTLKSFFAFLEYDEDWQLSHNPTRNIKPIKVPRPLPKYMTCEEARDFLGFIKEHSRYPERDFAIFQTFLQCGLRLSELIGLTIGNVKFQEGMVKVLGKGSKERFVPITPTTSNALLSYLRVRKPTIETDIVFLNKNGQPFSPRGIQYIFKKFLKESGYPDLSLSPHKLRHSCLTMLHREGIDIRTLQEIAGHANISTTQIYTHVTRQEIAKDMMKHPLA